ncbi:MAG: YfbM family protein [Verrucomicrobiales bacterium]
MALVYCRVSPHNAKALLGQPTLIHQYLDPDNPADPPARGGFFSRLFGGGAASSSDSVALEPRTDRDEGDADKAWNAIHFLLTGSAEGGSFPLSFILEGGQPVGDEDVGYGPARIFTPIQVAQIDSALTAYTEDGMRSQYDGKAMDTAKVYPQIWGREREDNFGYAWQNFTALREFIQITRSTGSYLMLYLS